MKKAYLGSIAISLKGRDTNKVYAVLDENDDFVYLADGKHRKVSNPKMKRKKHIKCFHANKLSEYMSDGAPVTDGRLRRALRNFTVEYESKTVKGDCREEE